MRATPKTTGVMAAGMSLALIMLSMNVVTAKAARPSGAEFPQVPEAGDAGLASGCADGCATTAAMGSSENLAGALMEDVSNVTPS
jgi:hypothetical protein